MTNYIYVGFIASTHGLDGKVKIICNSNLKKKIFNVGSTIYIGQDKTKLIINSYQVSGKYDILSFQDYLNIDLITPFLKQDIFVNLDELELRENEYLENELIGARVNEKEKEYGIVKEILIGKNYNYVKVEGNNNFYLPLVDEYVVKYIRKDRVLEVKNAQNLII